MPREIQRQGVPGPLPTPHPLDDQKEKEKEKAGGETSTRRRFDSGVSSSR